MMKVAAITVTLATFSVAQSSGTDGVRKLKKPEPPKPPKELDISGASSTGQLMKNTTSSNITSLQLESPLPSPTSEPISSGNTNLNPTELDTSGVNTTGQLINATSDFTSSELESLLSRPTSGPGSNDNPPVLEPTEFDMSSVDATLNVTSSDSGGSGKKKDKGTDWGSNFWPLVVYCIGSYIALGISTAIGASLL